MADYPSATFDPRTIENVSDAVYTPTKTTQIYAEDFEAIRDEIIAIEDILGLNANGAYDTVKLWLEALEAAIVPTIVRKYNQVPSQTPDGSRVLFTLPDVVVGNLVVYLNGARQTPTTDYIISGADLTFSFAPVGDKPLCDYDSAA